MHDDGDDDQDQEDDGDDQDQEDGGDDDQDKEDDGFDDDVLHVTAKMCFLRMPLGMPRSPLRTTWLGLHRVLLQ